MGHGVFHSNLAGSLPTCRLDQFDYDTSSNVQAAPPTLQVHSLRTAQTFKSFASTELQTLCQYRPSNPLPAQRARHLTTRGPKRCSIGRSMSLFRLARSTPNRQTHDRLTPHPNGPNLCSLPNRELQTVRKSLAPPTWAGHVSPGACPAVAQLGTEGSGSAQPGLQEVCRDRKVCGLLLVQGKSRAVPNGPPVHGVLIVQGEHHAVTSL